MIRVVVQRFNHSNICSQLRHSSPDVSRRMNNGGLCLGEGVTASVGQGELSLKKV
jgi:hypothetical protein